MSMYRVKRIYDEPEKEDGYRVLVDRLWPRGVSKERAALDEWNKDVAPSADLRVWFGHDSAKFEEFSVRYREELRGNEALANFKRASAKHNTVTLLYAARDPKINHAVVLRDFLTE